MDMCYDGTLVMPSSYAVMDEEEMSYLEGGLSGVKKRVRAYGIEVELNSTRANQFCVGLSAVYYAVGTAIGIVEPLIGIAVGAVSLAKSALITYFNNNNSGVYLHFSWPTIALLNTPGGIINAAMAVVVTDRG